jgi:hypothetical protein
MFQTVSNRATAGPYRRDIDWRTQEATGGASSNLCKDAVYKITDMWTVWLSIQIQRGDPQSSIGLNRHFDLTYGIDTQVVASGGIK